jgi:hypothetical protein
MLMLSCIFFGSWYKIIKDARYKGRNNSTEQLVPQENVNSDMQNRQNNNHFNLLVTRYTSKFNIQQLYVLPTLYLCVS